MKLETILNAMEDAKHESNWYYSIIGYEEEIKRKYERRARQYKAFRDRIMRMDEEKDAEIKILKAANKSLKEEWWCGKALEAANDNRR